MTLISDYNFTTHQIVSELDRYIISQKQAKKAVAIALRNRYRRMRVPEDLRDEIVPKNILMIGPTGVGKTEIARRLAKLVNAPFIKVEATKFTEIGYVGRDVESIIRDLMEIAVNLVRTRFRKEVQEVARKHAEERILEVLVGENASHETREKFRLMLQEGLLDDREIELKVIEQPQGAIPTFDIPGMPGNQMGVINLGEVMSKALGLGDKRKLKKMTVAASYEVLLAEESDKLLEEDKIIKEAIESVQNHGIVFLDEIDKITSKYNSDKRGGEVSREGVQRDLLPLIEGSCVATKYGTIDTSHILFIASGAFYVSKPADLLPELQGRLPVRVELQALTTQDMVAILKEPEASLLKQYIALMATENANLEFTEAGIERIAQIATEVNSQIENIGARRLYTILEKLLEEYSFEAGTKPAGHKYLIDDTYVNQQLGDLTQKMDLAKFIL